MAQYIIDIGEEANDGTGDPLRTAFNLINLNFDQIWGSGLINSNIEVSGNRIFTVNTNGNLVLAPNGIGVIVANTTILPETANIRDLGSSTRRWDTIYAQYFDISNGITAPEFIGDLRGSVYSDDSTLIIDAVDNQIFTTRLQVTGNITAGNISTTGQFAANSGRFGNIVISGDDITDLGTVMTINGGLTNSDFSVNGLTANILYIDAGTGTISVGNSTQIPGSTFSLQATNSMTLPRGNTGQRPGTPVPGMLRFNTSTDVIEVYTSLDGWVDIRGEGTSVTYDDQFEGDGSTLAFNLSFNTTTNGAFVTINGLIQVPSVAYTVTGNVLTFTEAPVIGDRIDVRIVLTTQTVTGISNEPGTAYVIADPVLPQINVLGNVIPASNLEQNLGNSTNSWNTLWANTVVMPSMTLGPDYPVMPQRPAFRVMGTAATTVSATNVLSAATGSQVNYNQASAYNSTTGVFTAPVSGLYQVFLQAEALSGFPAEILIRRNTLTTAGNVLACWQSTSTAEFRTSVTSIVQLNQGDTVDAVVTQGTVYFTDLDNWGVCFLG